MVEFTSKVVPFTSKIRTVAAAAVSEARSPGEQLAFRVENAPANQMLTSKRGTIY